MTATVLNVLHTHMPWERRAPGASLAVHGTVDKKLIAATIRSLSHIVEPMR